MFNRRNLIFIFTFLAILTSMAFAENSSFKIKVDGSDSFINIKKDQTITGPYELSITMPKDNKIARVDFKINQMTVSTSYSAPYSYKGHSKTLLNGLNFIQAIAFDKNEKVLYKKEAYHKGVNQKTYTDRAPRKTPTYQIGKKHTYKSGYIPVLMYHNIPETVHDSLNSSHVQKNLFKKQLELLLKNNFTPITFYDLSQYQAGKAGLPEKPFLVTFDDGYLDNYTEAFPILMELKVPATMFIGTAYVGVQTANHHFLWSDAKKMEESGYIDIQSHTNSHEPMDKLNETQAKYQINSSFEMIEQKLGKRDVKVLAYPQFRNTANTVKWAKELGCQYQMTNIAKPNKVGNQSTDFKRIHVRNDMSPEDLLSEILLLTK